MRASDAPPPPPLTDNTMGNRKNARVHVPLLPLLLPLPPPVVVNVAADADDNDDDDY